MEILTKVLITAMEILTLALTVFVCVFAVIVAFKVARFLGLDDDY